MLMDQNPLSTTDSMLDWMDTLIAYVRSGDPDLTNRQMAIIFTVYTRRGPHTVRGLAEKLKVSKPVITRALNKLGQLGYLRRQRDEADGRNVFVVGTDKGASFLDRFERFIKSDAEKRDKGFPARGEAPSFANH
ncbi:MarR family transcriptional regulator [Novosphingopyxis sp. YJ-S2-01]|nr:MarR family transcriptional regulator [Novosphingopyxis sp. YJ-S2-01]